MTKPEDNQTLAAPEPYRVAFARRAYRKAAQEGTKIPALVQYGKILIFPQDRPTAQGRPHDGRYAS